MKAYIDSLMEYANGVVGSDFPAEHVDASTHGLARKLVLYMYGNAAERAARSYAGLGDFASALAKGDFVAASFYADTQNSALLANWIRLRYWLEGKAEEMLASAAPGDDGLRYLPE